MAQPLYTLWHGTTTGAQDKRLRSILADGLCHAFNNPRICGQQPGVYFSATRDYAIARALRCVGKLQRRGQPVLLSIETDLAPAQWEWDYEVSADPANALIARLGPVSPLAPAGTDYAPGDYRYAVRRTEHICHELIKNAAPDYRRLFTAAANTLIGNGASVAFKYTGHPPLRVRTVEFI